MAVTLVAPTDAATRPVTLVPPEQAKPAVTLVPPTSAETPDDIEHRYNMEALASLMTGSADLIETLNQPAVWLLGPEKPGDLGPTAVANWLKEHAPAPPKPASGVVEGAGDVVAGVAGGAVPGVIEYSGKVPFAVLHGIKTAIDQAREENRPVAFSDVVHDAVTEAVGRKLMGWFGERPFGRVIRSLGFGSVAGFEDIAEHKGNKQSAIDAGVNTVIGAIAPEITPGEKARIDEAKAAAQRGDGKGAMRYLDPILQKHADKIAEATRTATQAIRPDYEKLTDDTKRSREAKERAAKSVDARARKAKYGQNLPAVQGKEVGEPLGEGPEVTRTPLNPRDVKRDVDASLALRIGQAAHFKAVMKARMEGWENQFRGMPTDARMDLISKYQKGGVKAVPDEWKPFFEDFEHLHNEIASSEHAAGIDYEVRENYVTGMWKDPNKAEQFFGGQKYRSGIGKPGFTKEKVFDTYLEGIEAGLEPLTTNPAVIAVYRTEASAMAMTRVLAMRDMVEDGYAIPVEDIGKPGKVGIKDLPGGKEMDVGGKRYLVHPDAMRLLNWALKTDRETLQSMLGMVGISPTGKAIKVLSGLGKAWMVARNVTIPVKLSFSAFHATHVMGIEKFQPISAALTQSLNRRLSLADFQKAIADSDQHGTIAYGRQLADIFKKPITDLTPQERLELNIMNLGGFNPAMPSVYEIRAEENWRRLWNDEIPRIQEDLKKNGSGPLSKALKMTPAAVDAAVLTIGRLSESFQGPMFRDWIPALKAASYMNEAKLTLASRPELLTGTPEANARLRQAMRTIQKSIDNRFGEMQFDTVFMPRVLRMGLQGVMLSVGWNFGFLREFGGAVADLTWPGKKPAPLFINPALRGEISSRLVYALPAYTFGALMFGGLMSYILSGKIPDSPKDLVYPLMPDGSRLNTPFFTREYGGIYYHILNEGVVGGAKSLLLNKTNTLASSLQEALANEDYYGRQIEDPNADMITQLGQGTEHMFTAGVVPISLQPVASGVEQPAGAVAIGFGGFSPAPKYVTRPAINTAILRSYSNEYPDRPIPYAEVDKFDETRSLKGYWKQWLKTKKPEDQAAFGEALGRYIARYKDRLGPDGAYLKRALKIWTEPDNAQQFRELDRATQEKILREASPEDRAIYLPYAKADVKAKFRH